MLVRLSVFMPGFYFIGPYLMKVFVLILAVFAWGGFFLYSICWDLRLKSLCPHQVRPQPRGKGFLFCPLSLLPLRLHLRRSPTLNFRVGTPSCLSTHFAAKTTWKEVIEGVIGLFSSPHFFQFHVNSLDITTQAVHRCCSISWL